MLQTSFFPPIFFPACFSSPYLSHFLLALPISVPKIDSIDDRLGPLVQDFKDLVYPADYNPGAKTASKRKPGQTVGSR